MKKKNASTKIMLALASASTGGIVVAEGCTAAQASAIFDGLANVAQGLNQNDNNNDVDLGDWLSSEIEDL